MAETTTTTEKIESKQAVSTSRYVHISPRKTRLVVDLIRGKSAAESVQILQNLRKKASGLVLKTLLSAVANAENNHKMDKEKLFVTLAKVDGGPAMKRYMPRAYGRASQILRPTSHITIAVEEKEVKGKKSTGIKFPLIPKREKKAKEVQQDEKVKNVAEEIVAGKRHDDASEQKKASKKGLLGRTKKTEVTRKGGEK